MDYGYLNAIPVEPNKGTKSFIGFLDYQLYQYVIQLITLGVRRISIEILGGRLLHNPL